MDPDANWLVAAGLNECHLIVGDRGCDGVAIVGSPVAEIWASESGDFPVWLRDKLVALRITADETQRLSELFVAARIGALGRIRPVIPASVATKLVFLPVSSAKAFAVPWKEGHLVVVTLGLFELLRTHAVNSMWAARLSQVEQRLGTPLAAARATLDLLNLRSLLFLLGALPLLQIEAGLPEEMRGGGWRAAELTTLFVMLHEIGHASYKSLSRHERDSWARGGGATNVVEEEELSEGKLEELYADDFALRCLPAELAAPTVHASLIFFTLLGYLEATGFLQAREHPLAINRLAALSSRCDPGASRAIQMQLRSMEQTRTKLAELRVRGVEKRLDNLVQLARLWEEKADWRASVKAVCTLAAQLPEGPDDAW